MDLKTKALTNNIRRQFFAFSLGYSFFITFEDFKSTQNHFFQLYATEMFLSSFFFSLSKLNHIIERIRLSRDCQTDNVSQSKVPCRHLRFLADHEAFMLHVQWEITEKCKLEHFEIDFYQLKPFDPTFHNTLYVSYMEFSVLPLLQI